MPQRKTLGKGTEENISRRNGKRKILFNIMYTNKTQQKGKYRNLDPKLRRSGCPDEGKRKREGGRQNDDHGQD